MSRLVLLTLCSCLVCGCSKPWDDVDAEGVPILKAPAVAEQDGPIGSTTAALTKWGCGKAATLFKEQAKRDIIDSVQQSFASAWYSKLRCEEREKRFYSADGGMAIPAEDSDNWNNTNTSVGMNATNNTDPDHSETNNQVVGVDEADFVKTDGKHIYILRNGALRIIKSWPAQQSEEIAKVAIDGTPKKLFVLQDRVLVYASGKPTSNNAGDSYDSRDYNNNGYKNNNECTYGYDCVPTGDGHPTWITIFDISDRSAPKKVREIKLSSSLLTARRIGSTIHTVVTERSANSFVTPASWPRNLGDICEMSRASLYNAFVRRLAENLEAAEQIEDPELFPTAEDTAGDDPFAACKSLYRSSLGDGDHYTSVISLELDKQEPLSAVTIFSRPGVVYSSADALYLSVPRTKSHSTRWGWYEGMSRFGQVTAIHKFTLSNDTATSSYEASGLVKGRLLNQFSLDEHEGYLRVASTIGYVGDSTNALTVLAHKRDTLETVGVLDGLAPTEDIRSVRFDGDRGYVVTFKEIDPLFVLDLSKPAAPKVLGELKIPGFSTYMHKMDDGHLLTIGFNTDPRWGAGIALQIFDVTNPTQPVRKHQHVISSQGVSSEALTNHLAFTYYAPKDLLAIPVTVCDDGYQMSFSGLMLLDVTTTAGFSVRGEVSHPMPSEYGCNNWWTNSTSQVKRSLIIDNFVYSISDTLMKVNDLDSPSTDLAALSFD